MKFPSRTFGKCRLCGSVSIEEFASLGRVPIGHHMRKSLDEIEECFAVDFHHCRNCGLVQNLTPISPEALYPDTENYSTSFQKPAHIPDLITTARAWRNPGSVIDIGCNDGALLQALEEDGYSNIVGIEPNKHAASLARELGFAVYEAFLNEDVAHKIVKEHGRFELVISRHVLEHVTDLAEYMRCLKILLNPDGFFLLELPQVEVGFSSGNPSILWEEHVNYFTESLIIKMMRAFGYETVERRYYAFGGGSNAYLLQPDGEASEHITKDTVGLDALELDPTLAGFRQKLEKYKKCLRLLITSYIAKGYRIALYGAAPRSCTVVNFCGIGDRLASVIDDRDEISQLYLPGTELLVQTLESSQFGPGNWLVLLGVGSENEGRVEQRLREKSMGEMVTVSLFPPRNTLASMENAMNKLD